jgi:hypothetical protein
MFGLGNSKPFEKPVVESEGDDLFTKPVIEGETESSSMVRRVVADPLVGLARGTFVGIPEALVGLADIPTLGRAGKLVEDVGRGIGIGGFKEGREFFDQALTPETRQAQKEVAETKGFFPTIGAALERPSTIVQTLADSIPSMVAGAGLTNLGMKALGYGATKITPELLLATKGATKVDDVMPAAQKAAIEAVDAIHKSNLSKAVVAGAVGEGAVTAGQNIEQVRQDPLNPSGVLTPGQVAIGVASGALTGVIGVLGGSLAVRLKLADPQTLAAMITNGGVPKTAAEAVTWKKSIARLMGTMVKEGLLEELPQSYQEQVAQNISLGKPWDEGAAEQAAMGMLAGMAQGGGAHVVQSIIARDDPHAQEIEKQIKEVDPAGELDGVIAKERTPEEDAVAQETIAKAALFAQEQQQIDVLEDGTKGRYATSPEGTKEFVPLDEVEEAKKLEAGPTLTSEQAMAADQEGKYVIPFKDLNIVARDESNPNQKIAQAEVERRAAATPDVKQVFTVQVPKKLTQQDIVEKMKARKAGVAWKPPMETIQMTPEEYKVWKAKVEEDRAARKETAKVERAEAAKDIAKMQSVYHEKTKDLPEGSALKTVLELIRKYGLKTETVQTKDVREDNRSGRNYLTKGTRQRLAGHDDTQTRAVRDVLSGYGFPVSEGLTKKGKYTLDTLADELNNQGTENPPDIPGTTNNGAWDADKLMYMLTNQKVSKTNLASEEVRYYETKYKTEEEDHNARINEIEEALPEGLEGHRADIETAFTEAEPGSESKISAELESFFAERARQKEDEAIEAQKKRLPMPGDISASSKIPNKIEIVSETEDGMMDISYNGGKAYPYKIPSAFHRTQIRALLKKKNYKKAKEKIEAARDKDYKAETLTDEQKQKGLEEVRNLREKLFPEILASTKDKRILAQKVKSGELTEKDVQDYETAIANKLKSEPYGVAWTELKPKSIGGVYEGTYIKDGEGRVFSVSETSERLRRAMEAQEQRIDEGGGRFPPGLIEAIRQERLANRVAAVLNKELEFLAAQKKALNEAKEIDKPKTLTGLKANPATIKNMVVADRSLKEIVAREKEISALLKEVTVEKVLVHVDAKNHPDYQASFDLAKAHGFEYVPIKDNSGNLNAFVNHTTKQIFTEIGGDIPAIHLVGHELGHTGTKLHESNEETQKHIDMRSYAYNTFKTNYEMSHTPEGEAKVDIPDSAILAEYAADLQGGFVEDFGARLMDGVFPGHKIDFIVRPLPMESKTEVAKRESSHDRVSVLIRNHNKNQIPIRTAVEELESAMGDKWIFKALLPALEKLDTVVSYDASKITDKTNKSEYDFDNNIIYINPEAFKKNADTGLSEALAHDSVIGFTDILLRDKTSDGIRLKNKIVSIMRFIDGYKDKASPEALKIYKDIKEGKQSLRSFMAYGLTNPAFASWLDSVPDYTSTTKKEKTSWDSVWTSLRDAVLRFVGKWTKFDRTQLDSLRDAMNKYIGPLDLGDFKTAKILDFLGTDVNPEIRNAGKYNTVDEYLKSKNLINTGKTKVYKDEKGTSLHPEFDGQEVHIFKTADGREIYEPVDMVSYVVSRRLREYAQIMKSMDPPRLMTQAPGKPITLSDGFRIPSTGTGSTKTGKYVPSLDMTRGWEKESLYLKELRYRNLWKAAKGEISREQATNLLKDAKEQMENIKNAQAQKPSVMTFEKSGMDAAISEKITGLRDEYNGIKTEMFALRDQKGPKEEISKLEEQAARIEQEMARLTDQRRTIKAKTGDVAIKNIKKVVGEATKEEMPVKPVATEGIESLDESLQRLADRVSHNRELWDRVAGLRDSVRDAVVELYETAPTEVEVQAQMDNFIKQVDYSLTERRKKIEVPEETAEDIAEREQQFAEEADRARAFKAGENRIKTGYTVENGKAKYVPKEYISTADDLISRGRDKKTGRVNEVGRVSYDKAEDHIYLNKMDIDTVNNGLMAIAKLFVETGTEKIIAPVRLDSSSVVNRLWMTLATPRYNKVNGKQEVEITRDGFYNYLKLDEGVVAKKGIERAAKREENTILKAQDRLRTQATTKSKQEFLFREEEEGQLNKTVKEFQKDKTVYFKKEDEFSPLVEEDVIEDPIDRKEQQRDQEWRDINQSVKYRVNLPTTARGVGDLLKKNTNWFKDQSKMSPEEFQKMNNKIMESGGLRYSLLRKFFSTPYHNAIKSVDWSRLYKIFGVTRVENREKLVHSWIMVGEKFLDNRTYFKKAGYSRKEIKDANVRIGRIITLGDENIRNIMFDLENQIAELDKKIKENPLIYNVEKLEKEKVVLRAKLDKRMAARYYSFEETKNGIDDNGKTVKLNNQLEYDMYKSVMDTESAIFDGMVEHMGSMLFRQYSNQKWYRILSDVLGFGTEEGDTAVVAGKLKAASQNAKTIPVNFKKILNRMNDEFDKVTDKEAKSVTDKYNKVANSVAKDMKELRDYLANLYGIEPSETNLLGEKKYAELDQAVKDLFFAYQRTKPRLQKIRDLRNDWRRWPGFFPRQREQGKMKMQMFESYADPKTGSLQKREVYSEMFNNQNEAATLFSGLVDKYGKNGELDDKYSFEYQPVIKTPEGAFEGIKDFNIQALVETAFENISNKGEYFDKEGNKVDIKDEMWDSLYNSIAGQFQSRGAASHGIHRKQAPGEKAIKGYKEEEHHQILIDHITAMAGLITKQEAAYDAMEVMHSLEDKTRMPELRQYVSGQLRNDNELDRFSSKLRSLAFLSFLGLMIKSAVVNSTQPFIVGIPVFDGWMRDRGIKGSGALAQVQASKDIAVNAGMMFKDSNFWGELKGISEWEKKYLIEGVTSGTMAAQQIRFIKGQSGDWGRVWNQTFDVMAKPFATMEKFNRLSSGLAMFRRALAYHKSQNKDGKLSEEGIVELAMEDANKFINDVHYPIGKHNLPIVMQGGDVASVGLKTAYVFRSFTHNFLLNQFNLLKSAARLVKKTNGETMTEEEVRKQATSDLITFVHTMALVGLFGGLLGMPFFKDLFDFWEKHFGYSPKQWARQTLRGIGGETLETFGMSGLPAVLGGNISGSLAIGVPFIGDQNSLDSVTGVWAGMGKKLRMAGEAALRGDPYRMATNLTPEFLRNPIVALTESDFGKETFGFRGHATTPQGMPSYDASGKPLKLSGMEVPLKFIGFQPTGYAREREIEQTVKKQVMWANNKKKNISESYRIDRIQNDPDAQKTMLNAVKELNAKIKENNIPVPRANVSTIIKNSRETKSLQKRRELSRRQELSGG